MLKNAPINIATLCILSITVLCIYILLAKLSVGPSTITRLIEADELRARMDRHGDSHAQNVITLLKSVYSGSVIVNAQDYFSPEFLGEAGISVSGTPEQRSLNCPSAQLGQKDVHPIAYFWYHPDSMREGTKLNGDPVKLIYLLPYLEPRASGKLALIRCGDIIYLSPWEH